MNNMKFYAAYTYRSFVGPRDIFSEYDTYEEAATRAYELLCDDDDAGVFINIDNKWYRVSDYNKETGKIVAYEYGNWDNIITIE